MFVGAWLNILVLYAVVFLSPIIQKFQIYMHGLSFEISFYINFLETICSSIKNLNFTKTTWVIEKSPN